MKFWLRWFAALAVAVTIITGQDQDAEHRARQLDSLSGGDVLRRYTGDLQPEFSGGDVMRSLLATRVLDKVGGGELLEVLEPLSGGVMLKFLDPRSKGQFFKTLNTYRGSDVFKAMDRLTGGDLLRALDNVEGIEVLLALDSSMKQVKDNVPKRTLDTLSGMAFGESKRIDSLSGAAFGLSKRNFDEIDNVGFNRFAKKAMLRGRGRQGMLSLAKRSPSSLFSTDYSRLAKKSMKNAAKEDIKDTAEKSSNTL